VEAGHGGRMHARNVPGRGACLGFDLPRAEASAGPASGPGPVTVPAYAGAA
ncbi:MAG: hypothetical protein JWO31_3788, partial [Phycisphaerales bacterium]|nr:hypothetical protein [Phycisphaerales bacterium]